MMFTSRQEMWHYYLEYEDGNLYWKEKVSNNTNPGDLVGSLRTTSKDYKSWQFQFRGKQYNAARVIFEMFNGDIPEGLAIDHKDTDSLNRKIENLRLATYSDQQRNKNVSCTSQSGLKGVYFDKACGKWSAKTKIKGRTKHIGYFESDILAKVAYDVYVSNISGEFFRS